MEFKKANTLTNFSFELVSSYLPTPIAEYIVERFCSDMDLETYRAIDFNKRCEECSKAQRVLIKRKHSERELIAKLESKECKTYFVVHTDWILNWKLFLFHDTEDDKFLKKYFFDSFETPQAIDNVSLVDADTADLREDLDVHL
jgi:hypothetical protein